MSRVDRRPMSGSVYAWGSRSRVGGMIPASRAAASRRPGRVARLPSVAFAAFAAAMVLASSVSSAAAAGRTAPFAGAAWTPLLSKSVQGCAKGNAYLPKWSRASGDGGWKAKGAARSCSKSHGGTTFDSFSESIGEIEVGVPINLSTGAGGVNVTWNLTLSATTAETVAANSTCPVQISTSDSNWGYTWQNVTSIVADCLAEAQIDVNAFAYVVDQKTGTTYDPSNYWSGELNVSGMAYYAYDYYTNYSNASDWKYNSTVSGAYSYHWGPSGTLSGSFAPTWFINGTFSAAHPYVAYTYVEATCYVLAMGFTYAKGSAALDADSGGDHLDLLRLSIW